MELNITINDEFDALEIIFDNAFTIEAFRDEKDNVKIFGLSKVGDSELEYAIERATRVLLTTY